MARLREDAADAETGRTVPMGLRENCALICGGFAVRCAALCFSLLWMAAFALAGNSARPQIEIPKVDREPLLEDFLSMEPSPEWSGRLAKVEGFRQNQPSDGQPVTQKTVVYMAYDEKHLYFVFVAFDEQPVRATLSRRDGIDNAEDWVEVALDTFNDQRRAYLFDCNALGVQWDALHSESTGESPQFDEVWHSKGKITDQGFVALLKIPFQSLRFPSTPSQVWGIQFRRWIPRIPETATWPLDSTKVEGRLSETAELTGLRDVSPAAISNSFLTGRFARSARWTTATRCTRALRASARRWTADWTPRWCSRTH